jgi:MFS transporter, DHA1 family, purine ribonucleoside efflux pump
MSQTQTANHAWSLSTWLSVVSLGFGTFALVSSEFLPAGLLTPLAHGIGISEGAAGQTVTATAIFGGIAAPTLALLIGRQDRKLVMLALCVLVVVSNIAVALASSYWILLGARMLLGIAIGGFWARPARPSCGSFPCRVLARACPSSSSASPPPPLPRRRLAP